MPDGARRPRRPARHGTVSRVPVLLALLVTLVTAGPAPAAWRAPVDGAVVRPFAVGPSPYAAGQHRGVDLAVRPGASVRAACTGRVTFAGPVPGRGRGVSVRCGALVATHLGLAAVRVRAGAAVVAGTPLGPAAGAHVQLGARRAGHRHGYLDPMTLLGARSTPPLGPAPPARRRPRPAPRLRRVPPAGVRPAPSARPRPARAPRVAPSPARVRPAPPARVPVIAWVGLGLAAAGLPLGALHRRRREAPSRRPARAAAG